MSAFTRGTTPDYRLSVNADLTGWDVYLSFEQRRRELFTVRAPNVVKTDTGCDITGRLTQKQTLRFREGPARCQVRAYKSGTAGATGMLEFTVRGIILDGQIPKGVRT